MGRRILHTQQGRAWFHNGLDVFYGNDVVHGLPHGENRTVGYTGSNMSRFQVNLTPGHLLSGSFLANLGSDRSATRVVAAVIDLAHAFGLTVTAEGVESPAALRVLQDLDCDQAQGYLFGRPAPPDQVALLLASTPTEYDVVPSARSRRALRSALE